MKNECRSFLVFVAAPALGLALWSGSAFRATVSFAAEKVRKPAVAGSFYPGEPDKLRKIVNESLNSAKLRRFDNPIKAVMAPHAGYYFCRQGLGAAYRPIQNAGFPYDRVILIGPSHRLPTKAAAVSSAQVWETPLGPVAVDTDAVRRLVDMSDRIEFNDLAHVQEHCLETQLPFLIAASRGKPFKIVPVLTGSSDPTDHEIVARALVQLGGDPRTLIVVSTDLSHYPDSRTAEKVDKEILDAVKSLDSQILAKENRRILKEGHPGLSCTMCGLEAVACLVRAANGLGITRGRIMSYTHSGMVSGENRRVVGYGAVVFEKGAKGSEGKEPEPGTVSFTAETRKQLIALARSAVRAAVAGEWVSYDPVDNLELQVRTGCFVTLKNHEKLRGCIGTFTSEQPLWKTVRDMAVSAATRDIRFRNNPITKAEVPDLEVEVSVLSRPRLVSDPLKEIKLGRDGIIIRDKESSGTFLPQVATETGWSLVEFLGHCSRDKAGLGWEGWKNPSARVFTYTATIIDERK